MVWYRYSRNMWRILVNGIEAKKARVNDENMDPPDVR